MAGSKSSVAQIRIGMAVTDAERLADDLRPGQSADATVQRLLDQFWLRSILIEQRRRTCLAERATFDERADHLLAALDPEERIA